MSEKSRIRWLCRRGMKELDVLLERFFAAEYDGLSEPETREFGQLLMLEDPDLYALLVQRMPPENAIQADLIQRITGFSRPR